MNVKQLLLISVLYTFSVQGMQEIKVAEENSVVKSVRTTKFEKLNKYVPNTMRFLFKILSKNDVPDEVIKDIILFLKTDTFKDYREYVGCVKSLYLKIDEIMQAVQEVCSRQVFGDSSGKRCESFALLAHVYLVADMQWRSTHSQDNGTLCSYAPVSQTWFKSEIPDLDIDKVTINIPATPQLDPVMAISDYEIQFQNMQHEELNAFSKISSWIKNHKFQSAAAVSATIGILGYVAKKLKK